MALGRKTGGRKKGTGNRFTAERKAFLQAFVDGNQEKAESLWLEIEDPATAFKLWLSAAEFCHPKKSQTDLTSGGAPVVVQVVKYTGEEK